MIRPTFHDFPADDRCYLENDEMLLGPNLLVAAVVDPGQRARPVYLPAGSAWYDFWTGDYYPGGQQIVLPAPWDRPPLLAKAGCVIPMNLADQHFSKPADQRGFFLFPLRDEGQFECGCFEDDGVTESYRDGKYWTWRLQVSVSRSGLSVKIERSGETDPKVKETIFLLPRQEMRQIDLQGGSLLSDNSFGTHRELKVALN
jgi:alpha-glucosidase